MEDNIQHTEPDSQEDNQLWPVNKGDIDHICRTCAKTTEHTVPIFYGVGLNHDLPTKIEKYLPVNISNDDSLPKCMCLVCANTLLGWHNMVTQCVEAEKKLHSLIIVNETAGDVINEICNVQPDFTAGVEKQNLMEGGVLQSVGEAEVPFDEQPVFQNLQGVNIEKTVIIQGDETGGEPKCTAPYKVNRSEIKLDHQKPEEIGQPLFCLHCGRLFHFTKDLKEHMAKVHSENINGTVTCPDCSAVFSSDVELRAHRNEKDVHVVKERSVCAECGKSYRRKNDLKRHIELKHSPLSGFHCERCGKKFNRKVCLEFHKKREHESCPEKNKNCSDNDLGDDTYSNCGSIDSVKSEDIDRHSTGSLQRNLTDKENEKGFAKSYSCSHCNELFTCRSHLIKHKKSVESGEYWNQKSSGKCNSLRKKFQCSDCSKSYTRKTDLARHQRMKHLLNGSLSVSKTKTIDHMDVDVLKDAEMEVDGNMIYHCKTCGKNIMTKRGYIRHFRIHSGERPFTCHVCGKQYRSSTDLSRHLRCVHDGIKNYQCDICYRCFANKGTRNDHRRTHTGERPYICDICGKAFPTANSIYVHRRIHTDYFPHQCSSCEKRFRRRQQLIHHIRTHTGEKPHSCEICGKSFGVKDELSRHKRTHSTEKPHACVVCGMCFGQKRYLKNHTKTHHRNIIIGL